MSGKTGAEVLAALTMAEYFRECTENKMVEVSFTPCLMKGAPGICKHTPKNRKARQRAKHRKEKKHDSKNTERN